MSHSVMQKKKSLLSSRSRSQRRLMWSTYDSDYYSFWTADSLATRLGLMVDHHKPECFVKKMDYCVQGQGLSEGSRCRCLSRWYLLNRQKIVTKLGIVMHHHELECHAKRIVCYFQGESHSKSSYNQPTTVSTISSELLILLLQNLAW